MNQVTGSNTPETTEPVLFQIAKAARKQEKFSEAFPFETQRALLRELGTCGYLGIREVRA
jgi:hypothetical protein